jgi:hypothetical protein
MDELACEVECAPWEVILAKSLIFSRFLLISFATDDLSCAAVAICTFKSEFLRPNSRHIQKLDSFLHLFSKQIVALSVPLFMLVTALLASVFSLKNKY